MTFGEEIHCQYTNERETSRAEKSDDSAQVVPALSTIIRITKSSKWHTHSNRDTNKKVIEFNTGAPIKA
jgi:hypothetical protein